MKFAITTIAIATALLIASCVAEKQTETPSVKLVETKPSPVQVVKKNENPVSLNGWLTEYDDNIKSLVTEEMINAPDSRMKKFCDVWPALTRDERIQFYADVIYSIAKPESSYNPRSMYIEDTMGLDALTGYPVASEGHLQISYQDSLWYKECKFNWPAEKDAFLRDMSVNGSIREKGSFTSQALDRSIQNPYVNHACGMTIIGKLLRNNPNKEFADTLGMYWSTMRRQKKVKGIYKDNPHYKVVWQQMKSRNTKCK